MLAPIEEPKGLDRDTKDGDYLLHREKINVPPCKDSQVEQPHITCHSFGPKSVATYSPASELDAGVLRHVPSVPGNSKRVGFVPNPGASLNSNGSYSIRNNDLGSRASPKLPSSDSYLPASSFNFRGQAIKPQNKAPAMTHRHACYGDEIPSLSNIGQCGVIPRNRLRGDEIPALANIGQCGVISRSRLRKLKSMRQTAGASNLYYKMSYNTTTTATTTSTGNSVLYPTYAGPGSKNNVTSRKHEVSCEALCPPTVNKVKSSSILSTEKDHEERFVKNNNACSSYGRVQSPSSMGFVCGNNNTHRKPKVPFETVCAPMASKVKSSSIVSTERDHVEPFINNNNPCSSNGRVQSPSSMGLVCKNNNTSRKHEVPCEEVCASVVASRVKSSMIVSTEKDHAEPLLKNYNNCGSNDSVQSPSSMGVVCMNHNSQRNFDFSCRAVRGPRSRRGKDSSMLSANKDTLMPFIRRDEYNKPDFEIEYDQAKFFMMKSFSEDDIQKSIKYNVWSSTQRGNIKLDAVFSDVQMAMKEKGAKCPIFLFFSVNGSGQFVGLAEMTGPVDFKKDMDFWEQDVWTGFFPLTWHIIKDIPNRLFQHITLENNDHRPVTYSRDTQEIGLLHGLKMLRIFKGYLLGTSLLDDYEFYEKKAKLNPNKRSSPSPHVEEELFDEDDDSIEDLEVDFMGTNFFGRPSRFF